MALNITQDTMTYLNSMNMGAITNKTELPKWSEIEPLINGYAKITKFASVGPDHELKEGQQTLLEQFEGLYADGAPKGFGRWYTALGVDAYRCELGYFEGRALHGKGKVFYKLKGDENVQKFEGLYSAKLPSWFYNKPVTAVTITSFEENELPR